MKQSNPKEVVQSTSLQQVRFNDGMIVTAEDLQEATSYPLDVFRTLIRAFFGCGIVCGLKVVTTEADEDGKSWSVEVKPGVALDCHGHPIELCRTVKFKLNEAYLCDPIPECVCIAIRRYTTEENPRPNPSCSEEKGGQAYDCTRVREQVMIKVFDSAELSEPSRNICMEDPGSIGCASKGENQVQETDLTKVLEKNYCGCIKTCSEHECCGDAWVLLACIALGDSGVECVENRLRKYVKPIHCFCPPEEECIESHSAKENVINTETAKPVVKKRSVRRKTTPQKEG